MPVADYLIVGAGLTGSVIARMLSDAGRDVLVLDRRSHLGGNVHDHTHKSGIRIHTYGPHYFRTSSERIWEFVNRFSEFYKYEVCIKSDIYGELVNWPISASYIRKVIGNNWLPEFVGTPSNFEDAALKMMPRKIYELFVKEYTEKQWGVSTQSLSAKLIDRFNIRFDDDPRLTPHARFQGIPSLGYAHWMQQMLNGVSTITGCDYNIKSEKYQYQAKLIYTGPIDEFFGYDIGKLKYRYQRREHKIVTGIRGNGQACGQINNPLHSGGPHIRTLEWKQMMPCHESNLIRGTILTTETPDTPTNPNDYEYPFPDDANAQLYHRYRLRAKSLENIIICGRLGEYRYFDMDQAIARAMTIAEQILNE